MTEEQRRERRSGWLLALLAATLVIVVGLGAIYINRTAERYVEQSEQRDCETLAADIEAIESAGQLTEAGVRVTLARRGRYHQIGCEPPLKRPDYQIIVPSKAPR